MGCRCDGDILRGLVGVRCVLGGGRWVGVVNNVVNVYVNSGEGG